MNHFSLSHLSDHILLRELAASDSQDRTTTAVLLAQLAEVDARKLYLPAGYPSMYAYCVGARRWSEDMAFKRLRAARTARKFPTIFPALADGSLSLSSVLMLTPHLAPATADELLAAAIHRTNAQIELLLAERFPGPDLASLVQAVDPATPVLQVAVRPVVPPVGQSAPESVPASAVQLAARPVDPAGPRPRLTPLTPQRFGVQFTMDQEAHDELRYLQALLGHAVPSGDLAEVFRSAVRAKIEQLEKRSFAATSRPRPGRGSNDARHVPAAVKREVWGRDGGRCTFVSDRGHRCEARTRLEFDHVDPVARGGGATPANLRLRCAAHNQFEAERTFGRGFMDGKREAARHARMEARTRAAAGGGTQHARAMTAAESSRAHEQATGRALSPAAREVIPWLRGLGARPEEARRAAELCEAIPDAPLEDRVRHALRGLAPGRVQRFTPIASEPS